MDSVHSRQLFFLAAFSLLLAGGARLPVQGSNPPGAKPQTDSSAPRSAQSSNAQGQEDPLQRPAPAETGKHSEGKPYQRFRDDVRAIITPEEEAAFRKLTNNAERDQFIELFWQRRNPHPDSAENEFKEEHYRRLTYANEHFAAGIPGSKTDRGRIYIIHGQPDSIDAHPAGGPYQRSAEEGGGQTTTYPFEIWRYRHLEGIGEEMEIEFVDTCGCGEYHMTLDRGEKDISNHVPGAGPTILESMGLTKQSDRLRGGIETLGPSPFSSGLQSKEFDRMMQLAKANAPPPVKYRELDPVVTSRVRYNFLPFDVQVDFVKAAANAVLVPITIQVANRELTYVNKDGVQRASLSILGRLTTLTGKVAQSFEEPLRLEQPAELFEKFVDNVSIYQKAVPLPPGHYRLDIVLKDVNGDKLGYIGQSVTVPDFSSAEKLASSTLIVADVMHSAPASEIGTGSFVIGNDKVRPRVGSGNGTPATFKRNQKVNLWMQVYNLSVDDKTGKPSATIEYHIVNIATNKLVLDETQSTDQLGNVRDALTLAKSLPPNGLDPGIYRVTIRINDLISNQTISPAARFAVE